MVTSKCSKCKNELETHRLGKYRYCILCHNKRMRETRPKHSELSDEQRLKANCRSYVHVYIKRKKITKQPCSICNTTVNIEAHHENYTKPLEIVWLCREHHLEHHSKKRAQN